MLAWRGSLRCQTFHRFETATSRNQVFPLRYFDFLRVRFNHTSSQDGNRPAPTVAIVGSGPAGFYTAQKLLRALPETKVDMYEQLPVPFGLVRFGVAPDHPEVKNCQDTFNDVASSPNYRFIGNVHLGVDLPLPWLATHYDAIVFAYGASKDRKLGLPGEDKAHIYSARAFVGWYNGLPEYRDLSPDLTAGEQAIVVGQGNVALDVARTLLEDINVLRKTDITAYALDALSRSKIRHVRVIGRRGPLQAAFTIKEVRELIQLPGVEFEPLSDGLLPEDLTKLPRPKRRIMELLKKASTRKGNPDATKSWALDFLLSPIQLEWSTSSPSSLTGVTFRRNELLDPLSPNSKIRPNSTSEDVTILASTLFRSIGYRAEPITGMAEIGAVFDVQNGTVAHDGTGRIISLDGREHQAGAGLYCAGWVKRGPTGVIASTMNDAFETAEAIVEDWKARVHRTTDTKAGWEAIRARADREKLPLQPVFWEDWERIDAAEKKRGQDSGKPREKITTVRQMLEASRRSKEDESNMN